MLFFQAHSPQWRIPAAWRTVRVARSLSTLFSMSPFCHLQAYAISLGSVERSDFGRDGKITMFGYSLIYLCEYMNLCVARAATNRIHQRPGLLNAVAGWMNTLINIYTSHGGHWSTPAIFTFVLISLYMLSMLALNLAYNRFLKKMKTDHDRELARQRIERKYSEAPRPMS